MPRASTSLRIHSIPKITKYGARRHKLTPLSALVVLLLVETAVAASAMCNDHAARPNTARLYIMATGQVETLDFVTANAKRCLLIGCLVGPSSETATTKVSTDWLPCSSETATTRCLLIGLLNNDVSCRVPGAPRGSFAAPPCVKCTISLLIG